jgi:hypothetical protein
MSEPHTLLTLYPELTETPTSDIRQRTRWNVRDSHATLIITQTEALTRGTALTYRIAQELKRPCFVHQTNWHEDLLIMWLGELPNEITLNVAGPRESTSNGIYDEAYEALEYVFGEMCCAQQKKAELDWKHIANIAKRENLSCSRKFT